MVQLQIVNEYLQCKGLNQQLTWKVVSKKKKTLLGRIETP
jgi:hypothetical protein